MIGNRHVGYFIHNTIKPLIEELDQLMGKCQNLKFDKVYFEEILSKLIELELSKATLYCVTYLAIAGFLCLMVWLIVGWV